MGVTIMSTKKLGKYVRGGFYVRKRDDFPKDYIHYDLGNNKTASQKYAETLKSFTSNITNRKLKSIYAKKVEEVYKPKNPTQLKSILKAADYLKDNRFSEQLSAISSAIMTNVVSASGVSRVGRKADKTRRLANQEKQIISSMSQEATVLFDNIEKMMQGISATFQQNDMAPYLTLMKQVFKGDPEMIEVLNALGSAGNHVLNRKRIEQLNKGMQSNFNNIKRIMSTVQSSGKTLAGYLQGGGSLNFGGKVNLEAQGGDREFQIARLVDIVATAIATLGGAMYEALFVDVVQANKIMSWFNKDVMSGLKLGGKGNGMYITQVKFSGSDKDADDSMGFKFKTTDIEMILTKNSGRVKIDIPVGVSLKKSSASSKGNMNEISIKSSSFSKLRIITKARVLSDIWTQQVDTAMANVFANHEAAPNPVSRKKYRYGGINSLLNKLNLSFIVAGLAGGLSSNDLATVFIVNQDAYNIFDMIGKANIKNISGGLNVADLSTMQNWNKWAWSSKAERVGKKNSVTKSRDAAVTRSNNFYWDAMEGRKKIAIALKLSMKI